MRKSRYTEEQIAYCLRQAESRTVADVCRHMGIAEATFYIWKKKYASLGVSELRQMQEENARLKRLVADLILDKQILQEVIRKRPKASPQARAGVVDLRSVLDYGSSRDMQSCCGKSVLRHRLIRCDIDRDQFNLDRSRAMRTKTTSWDWSATRWRCIAATFVWLLSSLLQTSVWGRGLLLRARVSQEDIYRVRNFASSSAKPLGGANPRIGNS